MSSLFHFFRPLGQILLFLQILLMTACLPGGASVLIAPTPTRTPSLPTTTPTTTPVWFPPTATPTFVPAPTGYITPTLDVSIDYGALVLSDDFTDTEGWTTGREAAGVSAFGKGELSLAVKQRRGYLYSLRQDTSLKDFYLEITASPSICRGEDAYGLLLRVAPSLAAYRFSLTCNGQTHLERLLNDRIVSLYPAAYSGAVPPGAPSQSRLGVLMRGKEFSFYVNGFFQFSARDPSLSSGGFGVFAHTAGEDEMTVSFSDLQIYALP